MHVHNNKSKAFTITEMLISIAMSIVLLMALYELYESTQKIFFNTNSISGAINQSYNTYAVMQKFLDKWGMGVPSNTNSVGNYPPPSPNYVSISSGSPCDSLTFYGDLHGFGMVTSVNSSSANLISCRLSSTDNSGNVQYYYLIRGNNFYSSSNIPDMLQLQGLSVDNVSCILLPSSSSLAANVTSYNYVYDATVSQTLALNPGDVLYAIPSQITFFCQQNPNDNYNNWLYIKTINESTSATNIQPISPVSSLSFLAYPNNCQSTNTCNMIQATIGVSSQEKNASGGISSITFSYYFYK